MSFVDNVKYVQHVENNTPRLLVLKNYFRRATKRFGFLNHILLDVIIPKVVFLVVSPEFICIRVGWQSIFEEGVVTPVFEYFNDIVILRNDLTDLYLFNFCRRRDGAMDVPSGLISNAEARNILRCWERITL